MEIESNSYGIVTVKNVKVGGAAEPFPILYKVTVA